MKYFEIHVTYDNTKDAAGYSIFVAAEKTEDTILDYVRDNHLLETEEDINYVDYIDELTKEEFETFNQNVNKKKSLIKTTLMEYLNEFQSNDVYIVASIDGKNGKYIGKIKDVCLDAANDIVLDVSIEEQSITK